MPAAELTLKEQDGRTYVFDMLRHRYVVLTPEEWVRQHFVHFLITHKGYPAAMLGNEISFEVGNTKKRCDTVLYDKQARPRMIVEYKAPHISINQKVFDQISRYNMALHVDYLVVSNGLTHYCLRMNYEKSNYAFLPSIPMYGEL